MYLGRKRANIPTVGDLKRFIAELPDDLEIHSSFDEPMRAVVWEDEDGEHDYLGFDDLVDDDEDGAAGGDHGGA